MLRSVPGLGLAAASLLIHGALLFSIDRAYTRHELRIEEMRQEALRRDLLQFEFVEAPPKTSPMEPEKSGKVSDRDALNQDRTEDKSAAQEFPKTEKTGLSDQLAQRKTDASNQVPTPETAPSEARPESAETVAGPPDEARAEAMAEEDEASIPEPEPAAQARTRPAPETPEQPVIYGLTGQDKITTEETGRQESKGAALFGETSFEATGSEMGAYMKNLKEKIWLAWFPHLAFKYPLDFEGADAVFSITLNARGEVKIIRVLESKGDTVFTDYCLSAIQRAGNFGPLPPEILALVGQDTIEIRFGFHYN